MAAPACSTGRSTTRCRASATTAGPGRGTSAGPPAAGTISHPRCSPRCCGCPAIRSRWPPSGPRGILPATVAGRAFSTDEARGLFAGAAAHSFLPLSRPFTTSMGLMLLTSAHVAGWPSAQGGSQAIADAMACPSRRARRHDRDGTHRSTPWTTSRSLGWCSSTSPPGSSSASAAMPCRTGTGTGWAASSYGPGVFKVDYALSAAGALDQPGRPPGGVPPPRRHAPGDRRRRGRRGRRSPPGAPVRAGRPSPASSIPPAPPPVSTRSGRTATCRPARRWT